MPNSPGVEPDHIDLQDEQGLGIWAERLNATPQQVRDAVRAVGGKAADVELYLKGSRSSSNEDRVKELGG